MNPTASHDEVYRDDGLHRLRDMQRGTLNASKTGINSMTFAQCWTLDSTGNWKGFREDSDGDATWDLVQARASNPVNEITQISNAVGASWATPSYNRAGNMTSMPRPTALSLTNTGVYDAWNRLVALSESGPLMKSQYDGLNRRTVKLSYSGGVLNETRDIFYSSSWQALEESIGAATPERQTIYGLRYIDDVVLRDRDTTASGTFDEHLYALQDANWNVTAVIGTTGTVQERYGYDAYGLPVYLSATFSPKTASSYAWDTLFAGYRFEANIAIYVVRNRWYSALLGCWLQRDPLGLSADVSLYRYVFNAPSNLLDPSGLAVFGFPQIVGTCLIGAAIGVGISVVADIGNGNLGACHTGVQSLLNALLGCFSGVALGSPNAIRAVSMKLVEALRYIGWERAAQALYSAPTFRRLLAGGVGIAIASLSGLSDLAATAICNWLTAAYQDRHGSGIGMAEGPTEWMRVQTDIIGMRTYLRYEDRMMSEARSRGTTYVPSAVHQDYLSRLPELPPPPPLDPEPPPRNNNPIYNASCASKNVCNC